MKLLMLMVAFVLLNHFLFAQDTVQKLQVPMRMGLKSKVLFLQQTISNQINNALDSLVSQSQGKDLSVKNVVAIIENILNRFWKAGKLLGTTPSQAYFIRCGPQTMTQLQMQTGQLVVIVGIAVYEPAEFEQLGFERVLQQMKITS